MRVLGHIHSLNDEEVIERAMIALAGQTYPVPEILVVDNGSTNGTLRRPFPKKVTVIRHPENRGTSGGVATGLQYALAHDYEWIWVLDADSLPRKDALEKLVTLYEGLEEEVRSCIGVLSSSHVLAPSGKLFQGRCLTPDGPRPPKAEPNRPYCECDSTIWTGSLFNLAAVRVVGLPRCGDAGYWDDLSLDYGDVEFTFRIKRAGYRVLVHRFSVIDHPVGQSKQIYLFSRPFVSTNHPPVRRYLYFRNLVYFWLHLYPKKHWFRLSIWFVYRLAATIVGILVIEQNRAAKVSACLQAVWDGLFKNVHRRYE